MTVCFLRKHAVSMRLVFLFDRLKRSNEGCRRAGLLVVLLVNDQPGRLSCNLIEWPLNGTVVLIVMNDHYERPLPLLNHSPLKGAGSKFLCAPDSLMLSV